jgi:hypothetical protein
VVLFIFLLDFGTVPTNNGTLSVEFQCPIEKTNNATISEQFQIPIEK